MSATVRLDGGPCNGRTATLQHPLDLNVYVRVPEGWAHYRRETTRDRVAHFIPSRRASA